MAAQKVVKKLNWAAILPKQSEPNVTKQNRKNTKLNYLATYQKSEKPVASNYYPQDIQLVTQNGVEHE